MARTVKGYGEESLPSEGKANVYVYNGQSELLLILVAEAGLPGKFFNHIPV